MENSRVSLDLGHELFERDAGRNFPERPEDDVRHEGAEGRRGIVCSPHDDAHVEYLPRRVIGVEMVVGDVHHDGPPRPSCGAFLRAPQIGAQLARAHRRRHIERRPCPSPKDAVRNEAMAYLETAQRSLGFRVEAVSAGTQGNTVEEGALKVTGCSETMLQHRDRRCARVAESSGGAVRKRRPSTFRGDAVVGGRSLPQCSERVVCRGPRAAAGHVL